MIGCCLVSFGFKNRKAFCPNLYLLIFTSCSFVTLGPSGFRNDGIASSAVLSFRERRDRTADDAIPVGTES